MNASTMEKPAGTSSPPRTADRIDDGNQALASEVARLKTAEERERDRLRQEALERERERAKFD